MTFCAQGTHKMNFTGVIPILATPFNDDETFDAESMAGLVGMMKRIGVNGITVLGVLGEANRLNDAEREAVVRTAVASADGLPVIAGASASGTRSACDLACMAESLGASAVMITPHAEATPSDAQLAPLRCQRHPTSVCTGTSARSLRPPACPSFYRITQLPAACTCLPNSCCA